MAERSGEPQMWWSDAPNDPWRNPASHAVIVSRAVSEDPQPELAEVPPAAPATRPTMIVVVAMVSALLAGALGGALGYFAASRNGSHGVVLGGSPAPQRPPGSVAEMVGRVMPSVVTISSIGVQGESIGSGFVISSQGHILTNEHVVADLVDRTVTVTFSDSSTAQGRVVGRDPESDLAVIKVDRQGLRPVELGNSDQVAVGDSAVAIGSPLALPGTVTSGIVSALDRTIATRDASGEVRYYAAIQTDAAINKGNSGGPLFDTAGRVIGVNSVIKSLVEAGSDEGGNIGIAFAIPINQATRIATEIIDTGKARRTVIGAELDDSRMGVGARLTTVSVSGPAAAAGLRTGDVVLKLGGHPIETSRDLIALVRRYDPGSVVTVTYRRGPETQTASVTLVADAK